MGQNSLTGRVERLERHRPAAQPVFAVHGQARPDGRCPDCDRDDGSHFTISIDRDDGRLERRYIGIDLALV